MLRMEIGEKQACILFLAEEFKSRVFLEKTINAINMTEDMKPELRTKSLWSIWMFGLKQGLAFIL